MWPTTYPFFAFNLGLVWKYKYKWGQGSHDQAVGQCWWSGGLRWVQPWCHGQPVAGENFGWVCTRQLLHVTPPVKAAGLSCLWEKARKEAPETSVISIFSGTESMPSSALLCNGAERPWRNFSHLVCNCSPGTCLSFLTDDTCLGPWDCARAQRLGSGLQEQTAAAWRYWFFLLK